MTTFLELFAGCGGAALGLDRDSWRHLACVERDEALRRNPTAVPARLGRTAA